jgi:DNA primase catalytic core
MKNRLVNLEAATNALKPFLYQYLQEHGIDTSKNFRCINPKHEDQQASMGCLGDPNIHIAHCFSCQTKADIFTCAHFLEGKPIKGKEWIEENLKYLANKYGVQVEMEDLTPDEIYEYRTYEAYRLAADIIANPDIGDYSNVNKEIERRQWDIERLREWGIGTIDHKTFKESMRAGGFEPSFLRGIDLERSNLFNENNLLFTVYDENYRPVGFSARNIEFTKEDPSSRKYNNTRVTGLECNIFKKSERLYGFELAKDASSPLYLFEGQPDVITARHHGLINCACTMGTNLTDHHINLLKKYGIFNIVLVFDSDNPGKEAARKTIDEKLSPHKEFRVSLIHLPGGMDPDELFRAKGAEEFARLKRWDAFEWRIQQFDEEEDPEQIAEKVIPIILSERNHLKQEKMAKILAKRTGFDHSSILSELKRQRNEKEANLAERKMGIIEDALYKAKRNPDNAQLLLTEARAMVEDVQRKFGEDGLASETVLDFVLTQKETDENKTGNFAGFYLKPDGLGGIGARLNDNWRSGHWICVGGVPQAGKTSFVTQMAYEIASDERNNATVIYHSIDDAARFILFKFVANAADDIRLRLGHITNPNYWEQQEVFAEMRAARDRGYKKIIELVKDQRLVIKDASENNSLAYAENLLRYYREIHPDRNIVLAIDNFHKLPDYAQYNGHEKTKAVSNHVKSLTSTYDSTLLTTIEYKKIYEDSMPRNSDIADSRSIEYDSTCVIHLHNDVHIRGADKAVLVHEWCDELMPRVRVGFGKNKISGYEGREFLDFFPAMGVMKAVDLITAEEDQKARIQFLLEEKKNGRIIS